MVPPPRHAGHTPSTSSPPSLGYAFSATLYSHRLLDASTLRRLPLGTLPQLSPCLAPRRRHAWALRPLRRFAGGIVPPPFSLRRAPPLATVAPASASASGTPSDRPPGSHTTVLILGGTGRVGVATAIALIRRSPRPLRLLLGGRSARRGAAAEAEVAAVGTAVAAAAATVAAAAPNDKELNSDIPPHSTVVAYTPVDIRDSASLAAAIATADVVLHVAGPFQGSPNPTAVLSAAAAAGVPYVDICDDTDAAAAVAGMDAVVFRAGGVALITTGIYPGVSNLLAAAVAERLTAATATATAPATATAIATAAASAPPPSPAHLRYWYYTAGSGGVGRTVLESTFHLLAEPAAILVGGEWTTVPPASSPASADYGGSIGLKEAYALHLPEVASTAVGLAVSDSAAAAFGTDPPVWNALLRGVAAVVPPWLLRNTTAMRWAAAVSMPAVRAVDALVGGATAMRVAATADDGRGVVAVYRTPTLTEGVGAATAAFVLAVLRSECWAADAGRPTDAGAAAGRLPRGVVYPEALPPAVRAAVLADALAGGVAVAEAFDVVGPPGAAGAAAAATSPPVGGVEGVVPL
ncbi:hypothetical protein MMPV_007413 [Pyropia vietnamensis]